MAIITIPRSWSGNWSGSWSGTWSGSVPGSSGAGVLIERAPCECCQECPCDCVSAGGILDRYEVVIAGFPDFDYNISGGTIVSNTQDINGTRQHIPLNEHDYTLQTICTSEYWTDLAVIYSNRAFGIAGNCQISSECPEDCLTDTDPESGCFGQPIDCQCWTAPKCCLFAVPTNPFPPEIPVPLFDYDYGFAIFLSFKGSVAELSMLIGSTQLTIANATDWDCSDGSATWVIADAVLESFFNFWGAPATFDPSGITVTSGPGTGAATTDCGPVIDPGGEGPMSVASAIPQFETASVGGKSMIVRKRTALPVSRAERCDHFEGRTEFKPGCNGFRCKGKCDLGLPAVPGKYCQTCEKYEPDPDYEGQGVPGWLK